MTAEEIEMMLRQAFIEGFGRGLQEASYRAVPRNKSGSIPRDALDYWRKSHVQQIVRKKFPAA